MNEYPNKQIDDTLNIIESTIKNCEKIQPKFKEGTDTYTRLKKIIDAMTISLFYTENAIDEK